MRMFSMVIYFLVLYYYKVVRICYTFRKLKVSLKKVHRLLGPNLFLQSIMSFRVH